MHFDTFCGMNCNLLHWCIWVYSFFTEQKGGMFLLFEMKKRLHIESRDEQIKVYKYIVRFR